MIARPLLRMAICELRESSGPAQTLGEGLRAGPQVFDGLFQVLTTALPIGFLDIEPNINFSN